MARRLSGRRHVDEVTGLSMGPTPMRRLGAHNAGRPQIAAKVPHLRYSLGSISRSVDSAVVTYGSIGREVDPDGSSRYPMTRPPLRGFNEARGDDDLRYPGA
jgi:hypothetical protein